MKVQEALPGSLSNWQTDNDGTRSSLSPSASVSSTAIPTFGNIGTGQGDVHGGILGVKQAGGDIHGDTQHHNHWNTYSGVANGQHSIFHSHNHGGRNVSGQVNGENVTIVQGDYYVSGQPLSMSSSIPSQLSAEDRQQILERVQTSLKEMYLESFKKTNPFSLPFTFDIENTWVSLALREDKQQSQPTENHAELLKNAFAKEKVLIIEGRPATGKTSLMRRLAYEWANGKQELFHFDLIIYAEFREVREQTFESVANLVLEYTKSYIENEELTDLKSLLSDRNYCKQQKILVLLDGYDESSLDKQCDELTTYLTSTKIKKPLVFNIVMTTRPGYLTAHRGKEGKYSFADVLGFISEEQKERYISNHFSNTLQNESQKTITEICNLLNANENLKKLAETPLFLTFICLVHERIVDGTLVELYCNIIWWLIDRHQQDFPNRDIPALFGFQSASNDKFETIQEHFLHFPQLVNLGKMALHNLEKDIFEYSDYQQFNLQLVLEQVGLLRKEKKHDSSFKLVTSFFFPHRTVKEFLAALYCFCSSDPTSKWLLPNSSLVISNYGGTEEFKRFLLRIALSDNISVQAEKRKYFFNKITYINLDIKFDTFNTTAGFNDKLLELFLSQCKNVQNIQMTGEVTSAKQERNILKDTSEHYKSVITSNVTRPTLFSFNDLMKLHSLAYEKCIFNASSQLLLTNCRSLNSLNFYRCEMKSSTNLGIAILPEIDNVEFYDCVFEAHSQLTFRNCQSLKNLKLDYCKMKSSTKLDFATLSAIDTLKFNQCTFEASSQLSITNCPPLKYLKFDQCKMECSTNLGIATLPAIETVEFHQYETDLATWQSILDQIQNNSVKCLKLTFGKDFNKELLVQLQKCNNIEKIEITVYNYTVRQNDLLSFTDLIKLQLLSFDQCIFEAASQLSFMNCSSLKNLQFIGCEMNSSTITGIATLLAIDTVEFHHSEIDLVIWQSIVDQIQNNSVKCLKLTFGKDFNKQHLVQLQKCNNIEEMEITMARYIIGQNNLLPISDMIKLHSVIFYQCIFEAASQLSFTNCPSLKNLIFYRCEIKTSTITGIATLPVINAVEFLECKIDLATWKSITDAIKSSSIKSFKLKFEEDFNLEYLIHLQKCSNVEKINITIRDYRIGQNDQLLFIDLMNLHSLTFGDIYHNSGCTFEDNSQLSFTNCLSLKKLKFKTCKMKSCTNLGIATLSKIDTVQFYGCEIDMATWQSITDQIRNSPVRFLQLSVNYILKATYPEFLNYLQNCERIQKIHVQDVQNSDDSGVHSLLNRNEAEVTAILEQIAQILPELTTITIAYTESKRRDERKRLREWNRLRIEKAGQERNPEFSIKYVE